jgi:hypothetical protein
MKFDIFTFDRAGCFDSETFERQQFSRFELGVVFPIDELDDSLYCSYSLCCELGISVPRRIAAHLVELRNANSMNTIASINHSTRNARPITDRVCHRPLPCI